MNLRVFWGHPLELAVGVRVGVSFWPAPSHLSGKRNFYAHLKTNLHNGTRHGHPNTQRSVLWNYVGWQQIWTIVYHFDVILFPSATA